MILDRVEMIFVNSVVGSHESLLNWLANIAFDELSKTAHRIKTSECYLGIFKSLVRPCRLVMT